MVFLCCPMSNLLQYLKANSSPSTQFLLPPSYHTDHHCIDHHHKFHTTRPTTTPLNNTCKSEVLAGFLNKRNKGLSSLSNSYASRKANSLIMIIPSRMNEKINTVTKLLSSGSQELLQRLVKGFKLRKSRYICATMIATMCLSCRVEKVPFSERHHLVFKRRPGLLTRWQVDKVSNRFLTSNNKFLPPTHPKSIRTATMVRDIVQAMHTALGLEKDCVVTSYAPDNPTRQVWHVGKSSSSNNIIDDHSSSMLKSSVIRKNNGRFEYGIKHLEGREWKVVVVDDSIENAIFLPNYTIGIYRGLLDSCSDSELAQTISHEMGHAIGRHSMEIEEVLWRATMALIMFAAVLIYLFVAPQYIPSGERMDKLMDLILFVPQRRLELEADHISMMLMASAGYDPRAAPKLFTRIMYTKDDEDYNFPSKYFPARERARSLESPERMEKAIQLYRKDSI